MRLANESPSAAAFEAGVLEHLQRQLGFDVAFLLVRGAEAQPTTLDLNAATVARAVQRAPVYFEELLPVKRAALAARGVAVDTRVLGERRVRQTAYFRELGRAIGARHAQLMAYVPLRGQHVAALMLGRASGAFSDAEIAAVESLLPELGVARGSFGLPVVFPPLPSPVRPALLRGVDALRGGPVHASVPLGDMLVQVRDRAGFREMVARSGTGELVWTRAALKDPSRSGWPYIELLHLAAIAARSRRRALFIGCGGAVALRQFASVYPGIAIDVVEREPTVIELARQWYELDAIPQLSVHVADGVEFVQRAPADTWDVVVVDAFDSSERVSAWADPSWFGALRRALCSGGAVAINVIGTLDGTGAVPDVVRAAQGSFEQLRVLPVMVADEEYRPSALRNVVIVASRRG
ncbi:MAG: fused MFS/spermidine synthase [Deltaproteobacteria bacterium]